jgi:hypothetical protein
MGITRTEPSVKAARRLKRSQRVVVFIAAIGMTVAKESLVLRALPKPASEPSIESTPNSRAEQSLRVTVWVYNYAQVSAWTLIRAEREASRIFREVGVKTDWLECPLSAAEGQQFPGCQENSSSTSLILRIIPRFESTRAGFRATHLGFALSSKEGGIYASIFYHRVEAIALAGLASEPTFWDMP